MKLVAATSAALLLCLAGCPNDAPNEAKKAANDGAKALGASQWETAIERYQKAVERYRDHHSAWYYLGYAYSRKNDWKNAVDAAQHSVQISPGTAMYQMFYGLALYEKAKQQATEQQAASQNKKPEEVTPDLSGVSFEKALQHLQEAVKLNNDLWRAHYYLGRIYRDGGKVKEAADEFTKALQAVPPQAAPWVALADLYRAWDYTDQALAVATQGVAPGILPDSNEAGDLWYVVGMAYDDKSLYEKSIEAYTKALEQRRDLHQAKFQRGQAYFKLGNFPNAKRDLEEFSKTGGASVSFAKAQASKMLMDIAAKTATQPAPGGEKPTEKKSPEEMVKKGKKG
ncbi:MAG TPA: tetratricopeptide repeat protein [Kofleriaceae bacterium]|nr:tetratricopeptide repeat protein [Kofleriaceae bacterium]